MLFFFDLAVFENHLTPKVKISSSFPLKIDYFADKPLTTNLFVDSVVSLQTMGWLLHLLFVKEINFFFNLVVSVNHLTLKIENSWSFSLKFNAYSIKKGETNFAANTPTFFVSLQTIG